MPLRIRGSPTADEAWWGLRAHRTSTLLLIGTGAAAVTAALTVASIGDLGVSSVPAADLGIGSSSLSWTPDVSRRAAIAGLRHVLLGLTVAVLAVAAVTTLAVSLTRAAARRSELETRRAVGASRRQLRVAAFVEGVVMAAAALVLGTVAGVFGARWSIAAWPGSVGPPAFTAAALCAIVLAGVVLSGALFPALAIRRAPLRTRRSAIPHGFTAPVAQFGMSLAILVAASQLGRLAARFTANQKGVPFTGSIYEIRSGAPREQRAVRYASLLERLARSGTGTVSLASPGLLLGLGTVDPVMTDCGKCWQGGIALPFHTVPAILSAISPDTFHAMAVPLLRGRGLTASDRWNAAPVAVVNEALAAMHFEDGFAVGRKILLGRGAAASWFQVVGVVDDRAPVGFGATYQPPYRVFVSALQLPPDRAEVLVRPANRRVAGTLQAALGDSGAVAGPISESAQREAEVAPVKWFRRMVGFEGFTALALAIAGMFAVMQLWVNALEPELGVRRATGARRYRILGYMLARAALVGCIGVAVGLWIGEMTSGALAAAVAGLPARSPGLLLGPVVILLAATLSGALLPAWRAARVSPATAMAEL